MRFIIFSLFIALLFLSIVISQYVENESKDSQKTLFNQIYEKNPNINENYFNLSLSDYYFVNQTFDFNFSCNYSAKISILDYSMNYIVENITSDFILDLLPGDYYLEIEIPEIGYKNYTIFNVLPSEIEIYPREVYVNENVSILIKDYIGKNYSIMIEPDGKIFNFVKLNESEIFYLNFEKEGNYTIYINGNIYNLSVLKYKERILNVYFDEKNFFVYNNINFTINGSAYTSFNFSVFYHDILFFQIKGDTDQEGFYNGFIYIEKPGNYTIILEYDDEKKDYLIEISDYNDFEIHNLMDNYEKNVSFLIIGPILTDFYLYFDRGNYTRFYYLKTNSNGRFYFEDIFENGLYNISLVYQDKIVFSGKISVTDKIIGEYKIIGNDIIYELNENVSSDDVGILIRGKNITLNCNSHFVRGKNFGIFVDNSNNIELKNCIVENSNIGLMIDRSQYVSIFRFTVNKNSNGIITKYSKNIKVFDSDLSKNEFYGLLFFSTEDTSVSNTTVESKVNFEILEKIKN